MKAVIIARVSTEEQRDAGLSLPAQVMRLENYCQNKGFPIIKSFSFDESAYKDDRSEFDTSLRQGLIPNSVSLHWGPHLKNENGVRRLRLALAGYDD